MMKQMNNCNSNCNADNQFINSKKEHKKDRGISVSIDPSAASWDSTPNTCEEMINTYGTYEIQATADTEFMFPAISQGLPSEDIAEIPKHFHEGIVPKLID